MKSSLNKERTRKKGEKGAGGFSGCARRAGGCKKKQKYESVQKKIEEIKEELQEFIEEDESENPKLWRGIREYY